MRGQSGTRRTWTATRWLVLVALVLGVVAVPTPADAATSWWTPTESVGSDQASINYVRDLVITHDGRPLLVYTTGYDERLRARVQLSDGRWGAATTLFESDPPTNFDAEAVVTPDATFVVWTDGSSDPRIRVASLDGNTWTELPALAVPEGPQHFDAAVAPNGDVVVAWFAWTSEEDLHTASFDGSAWSAPTSMDFNGSPGELVLEVASDGTHVVALAGAHAGADAPGIYAYTVGDSGWSTFHRVSTAGVYADRATMAASSKGVVLAFAETPDVGDPIRFRVATFTDGAWSSTSTLDTAGRRPGGPSLAIAPDGSAHVALAVNYVYLGLQGEIRTYRHIDGARWSTPEVAVSLRETQWAGRMVDISFGPDGTAMVTAAIEVNNRNPLLVLAVRGPGKPWQDPGALDPTGGGVQGVHHVIDDLGQMHLVWHSWGWWATSGVIMPFDDVEPGLFYSGPVLWAAHAGLTTGVGGRDEFQPNRSITRAEAVTTLWRYHGEQSGPPSGFEDVARDAFYTRAVDWARHTGLTTGVGGSNRFEPNRTITRAELVTLLWRLDGSRSAPSAGFADVAPGAFYARSVNWAKHTGITTGVGGSNRFEPNRDVTRAEAFTFVYRLARSTGVSLSGLDDSGTGSPFGSVEQLRPVPLD